MGKLIRPNPHYCSPPGLALSPLSCKNDYMVFALGKETAAQAVVGSIVWAFLRLNKPRCREMSVRGYAFHSVRPQLSFFSLLKIIFFTGYGPPPVNPEIYNWFRAIDKDNSGHLNAVELQQALTNANWSHFNAETCRLMVCEYRRQIRHYNHYHTTFLFLRCQLNIPKISISDFS